MNSELLPFSSSTVLIAEVPISMPMESVIQPDSKKVASFIQSIKEATILRRFREDPAA